MAAKLNVFEALSIISLTKTPELLFYYLIIYAIKAIE